MSTTTCDRRQMAEVSWGGQAATVVWVGDRTLHGYWPVLAPYFRDVLLPPHRRDEEQVVAWQWTELPGAPTALELAALRQRLRRDGEIFADASEVAGNPSAGTERRGTADSPGLVAAVRCLVDELAALADADLAARVARTEPGLRIHSWGVAPAAAVRTVATHGAESRTQTAPAAVSAAASSSIEIAQGIPTVARQRRRTIAAAAGVMLAMGVGGWLFLAGRAGAPAGKRSVGGRMRVEEDTIATERRALVHAGGPREESVSPHGPARPVATVEAGGSLKAVATTGVNRSGSEAPGPETVVRAGPNSSERGTEADFESSREVAVARDTARPALGAPGARSVALSAGGRAAAAGGVSAVAAGAPAAAAGAAGVVAAGGASNSVAGTAEPVRLFPAAPAPPRRRPAPPVAPPAALDAGREAKRAEESRRATKDAAVSSRRAGGDSREPALDRRVAGAEEWSPPAPAAGRADTARGDGSEPWAAPAGEARARVRLAPRGSNVLPGDDNPFGRWTVRAAGVDWRGGGRAEGAGPAGVALADRWWVSFKPAGTRRLRAVILPTSPSPESEGGTMEALRAKVRREVAESCPVELRAPRWRHAIVLAAPRGGARTGWSWRAEPGTRAEARTMVADDRVIWEAPTVAAGEGGRWVLRDEGGIVRAEVEAHADQSVTVATMPGWRVWQRLALAWPANAGKSNEGDFAWESASGGVLPPGCQLAESDDAPPGGWIEVPLAGSGASRPETVALVDRRTEWAARVALLGVRW